MIKSGKIVELISSGSYSLILEQYKKNNFVFDLSGGAFSSKKFPKASREVRNAAKNNSIIIGLLPSKSKRESVKLIFEREKQRPHFKGADEKWLLEKTKKSLAKFPPLFKKHKVMIVYTSGKTPNEIADEIIKAIHKTQS